MRGVFFSLFALLALTACVVVPVPIAGGTASGPAAPLAAVPTSGFGAMLNKARADNGLGPLAPNARLAAAAQVHAQDMVQRSYFSHQSPNGATPATRVRAQGYCYRFLAENIGSGQPNEARIVAAWMGSPDHRVNMLAGRAREYGLGRVDDMWVLLLAEAC
ncbi:CAP domain-containing protein [Octadecabacter sp. SW4]|uniref:CAP domain-containing protein n=1 Tax=Octadecabacter sp. SW4 TaxID=2602067 RepID=UPI0011C1D4D2|nr:CAP domain-containing protein [Octadecabacter sp. SW4]QEE36225.1 CAP domain-containing protein [Octadecabacter sp. SW4]|tara:strand:+ start:230 stop:712 length:483 start_codon:yes stop_codon:yes gene_type:complete